MRSCTLKDRVFRAVRIKVTINGIASVLKLELVWWFVSAKKALVLKEKSLRQNHYYTHLFLA